MSVGSKSSLPDAITQHGNEMSRLIFVSGKDPANCGLGPKHRKQVGIHAFGNDPLRSSLTRKVECSTDESCRAIEYLILALQLNHVRGANGDRLWTGHRNPFLDEHKLLGIAIGKRMQDDRVNNAEDSAIGADAKGQREHRDGSKTGIPA